MNDIDHQEKKKAENELTIFTRPKRQPSDPKQLTNEERPKNKRTPGEDYVYDLNTKLATP